MALEFSRGLWLESERRTDGGERNSIERGGRILVACEGRCRRRRRQWNGEPGNMVRVSRHRKIIEEDTSSWFIVAVK